MNAERSILEAFAARYPASAMRSGGRSLRLRGWDALVPGAVESAEALESFLSAMERLEREGTLRLGWKRRREGSELEWAELADPERLYAALGLPHPDRTAEASATRSRELAAEARLRLDAEATAFFEALASIADSAVAPPTPGELDELAALLAVPVDEPLRAAPRSLSTRLYADSKRLERVVERFAPLAASAARNGRVGTDFAERRFPDRAWPEVSMGGRLTLVFADGARWALEGRALTLPLSTVASLSGIEGASGRPLRGLSVENKETFRAFIAEPRGFDLVILSGGHPNRAARAFYALCAGSGTELQHSGDLDPDGLAIAAEIHALCGALPWAMDREVFDRHFGQARVLDDSLVRRLSRLGEDALALGEFRALAARIAETGRGLEQEAIDYARLAQSG
ncbi:MAG: DUF2399 domain-containing protein [Spirochaetales bacterium]|nr:DUF2399 domain-containing protein [Spirochaetales bacterium]